MFRECSNGRHGKVTTISERDRCSRHALLDHGAHVRHRARGLPLQLRGGKLPPVSRFVDWGAPGEDAARTPDVQQ